MPRLRPFGGEEIDLGIDFDARNRASLVTRLLAQCTIDPVEAPPEFYRELSAGQRLDYLLRLAAGGPDQRLAFPCTCGNCRETLELELTVRELSELQRQSEAINLVGVELGGRRLQFRKPNGRDLEAWAEMVFDDEGDAVLSMISTLAVDRTAIGSVDAVAFGAIEDALDEADPLIDFDCVVRCSECGESTERSIDLLETALGMLRRAQQALIGAVHRLASQYHWSERDIFAVPAWRRQQYLRLIASGQ